MGGIASKEPLESIELSDIEVQEEMKNEKTRKISKRSSKGKGEKNYTFLIII